MHSKENFIKKITLLNYRNHKNLSVEFSSKISIISGENGAGKTNLLEAFSLFSSRSMRNPSPGEITCSEISVPSAHDNLSLFSREPKFLWGVNISLSSPIKLSIRFIEEKNSTKKILMIDEKIIKNVKSFFEYIRPFWIAPEIDHLFIGPSKERRDFMDRLISTYDEFHSKNILEYEKATKSRLKILTENPSKLDDLWLSSLEKIMTEKNLIIHRNRLLFIKKLTSGSEKQTETFPKFEAKITNFLEDFKCRDLISTINENFSQLKFDANLFSHDLVNEIKLILKNNRWIDGLTKMTHFGIHRSDLNVTMKKKNKNAKSISTGEQKMILIAIILSFLHQFLCEKRSGVLLLLFDDIISRLDYTYKLILFEEINKIIECEHPIQIIFSGTDREDFNGLNTKNFIDIT